MQTQTLPENPPRPPPPAAIDYSANVDTSRAFRSVKEAVAIFGERFLTEEILLPSYKPHFILPKQESTPSRNKSTNSSQSSSWKSCSSSCEISKEEEEPPPPSSSFLVTSLQKLESELEETKKELKLLKDRESETKIALDSLNAELQKKTVKNVKAAEEAVVSGDGGGEREMKRVKKKKPIIPLLFSKKKGKSNASFLNPLYSSSQVHWI